MECVGDVEDAGMVVGDEAVDLGGRRVFRDVELAGDVGIGAADGQGLMGAGDLDAGQGGQKLQDRLAAAALRRLVEDALVEIDVDDEIGRASCRERVCQYV